MIQHIAKPTAKLPDGKVVVDEEFLDGLVDTVNHLVTEVAQLKAIVPALASSIDDTMDAIATTKAAMVKLVDAVDLITGGSEK